MQKDFLFEMLSNADIKHEDFLQLSPLVLAYVGDAVFEVFIRTSIVLNNKLSVNKLHRLSTHFVSAKAQSNIIHTIMDNLSDDEKDIVRRGRNAKSGTVPKNADLTEYRYATGFESLIGYIYLKKDYERLLKILEMSFNVVSHE